MKCPFATKRPLTTAELLTAEALFGELHRNERKQGMHELHVYVWHRITAHISAHGTNWTRDPAERAAVLERIKALGIARYRRARASGEIDGLRDRHAEAQGIEFVSFDVLWAQTSVDKVEGDDGQPSDHEVNPFQEDESADFSPLVSAADTTPGAEDIADCTEKLYARLDAFPWGREFFGALFACDGDIELTAKLLGCTPRAVRMRLQACREGRAVIEWGKHAGPRGRYSKTHKAEAARRGISPRELYLQCGRL